MKKLGTALLVATALLGIGGDVFLILHLKAPSGSNAVPVEAQNATLQDPVVRIEPSQSVVVAGETFTVTVMIDEANDLGGFEFSLHYITTTITVDDVILGDFPGSTGRMAIPIGPIIDNEAGKVRLGAATVGSDPGPGGTGELAAISFTTQNVGASSLDLQNVLVLDTHAERQTVILEDGTVVVSAAPTATPTPTATSTPTSTPTATPTPSIQEVYLPLVLKGW